MCQQLAISVLMNSISKSSDLISLYYITGHITTMNEYNVLPQKRTVVKETVNSIT